MDTEDWEILPHGGFIDYHEGEENNYSSNSNPRSKFNMNYFVCPSSPPRMLIQPNRVVPLPLQLEPNSPKEVQIGVLPSMGPNLVSKEPDQDPISQVFFKKLKENELFVDMKMDSPKSPKKGLIIDAGKFDFQDKGEILDTPRIKNERADEDEKGLNLWKWSLSGIGAIWSFGFAAATVCVIIFGSQQRIKLHDHKHKYRFQIYADDKRIEQVVHNATKMNETIGAVRGIPISRAHITYGGYYEAL